MNLDVMLALEEARPPVAFEPDWREVLDRAGPLGDRRPRRRGRTSLVAAAAALVAVVAAATPALGLDRKLVSFFDLSSSKTVAQTWQQAGPRVQPTQALIAAARLTHVDPETLRRISAGGASYRRLVLVGGIGPDGNAWLGQFGQGWTSNFFPLFGPVGQVADRYAWHRTTQGWDGSELPMYARTDEHRQLFDYVLYGGSSPNRVSWATVAGFVRGDVARLAVGTVLGTVRPVALRSDGGFSYSAVTARELPRRIEAYDAKGRLIAIEGLALKPYAG